MNFNTLDDRVVVKKEEFQRTTESGLIITKPTDSVIVSEVVSVGPGKKLQNGNILPMTVEVGDKVMYFTNTGIDVKIDGVDYLVLHEHEIIGISED